MLPLCHHCGACAASVTGPTEAHCLLCSVPVFLHSHLLFCLPVFNSRQVSASFCWLIVSFLQPYPSPLPPQTHTAIGGLACTHITQSPCLIVPPSRAALFICPTVCVGDVNYLYCEPPLLHLTLNSPLLGANGFFCTHCSCLCACVLLV